MQLANSEAKSHTNKKTRYSAQFVLMCDMIKFQTWAPEYNVAEGLLTFGGSLEFYTNVI